MILIRNYYVSTAPDLSTASILQNSSVLTTDVTSSHIHWISAMHLVSMKCRCCRIEQNLILDHDNGCWLVWTTCKRKSFIFNFQTEKMQLYKGWIVGNHSGDIGGTFHRYLQYFNYLLDILPASADRVHHIPWDWEKRGRSSLSRATWVEVETFTRPKVRSTAQWWYMFVSINVQQLPVMMCRDMVPSRRILCWPKTLEEEHCSCSHVRRHGFRLRSVILLILLLYYHAEALLRSHRLFLRRALPLKWGMENLPTAFRPNGGHLNHFEGSMGKHERYLSMYREGCDTMKWAMIDSFSWRLEPHNYCEKKLQ